MALYLVQHGKSLPKDIDPEQGLSEEGVAEVRKIAQAAKGYHIQVRQILHSTKERARQTAAMFQAALMPQEPMQGMERLASFLISGSPEKRVFKFQNGGIVCLDREPESGNWFIKWALASTIA